MTSYKGVMSNDASNNDRLIEIIYLIIAALPLLVYPMMTMVILLGLAQSSIEIKIPSNFPWNFISLAMMSSILVYPLVYLYSVIRYIIFVKKKNIIKARKAIVISYIAFGLIIVFILLGLMKKVI